MRKSGGFLFFVILLFVIVPVSAEMGYTIHANVVGADVFFGGWKAGTIDENHQLFVPWPEGSTIQKDFLAITTDGYIEIWDELEMPWAGQIEDKYYTLYPLDKTQTIPGDIRLAVKPNGGDLYLRKPGGSDDWMYYGPNYGTDYIVRYIPAGTYDLLIREPGYVPVRDTVRIPSGGSIDQYYLMEEGEEDVEAAALGAYQEVSVAPTATPIPVPEGTLTASAGAQSVWEASLDYPFYCTALSPDGSLALAGAGNSLNVGPGLEKTGELYCFDSAGNNIWTQTTDGSVLSCTLSDSANIVGVGTDTGMLYSFDGQGTPLWKAQESGSVVDVALSADGSYLVGGSSNERVYFIDSTGTILWNYQTNGEINSVALSADGNSVVAGSSDTTVTLLDKTGNLLWEMKGSGAITSVSISSDGSLVAAGSETGKVYLFDAGGAMIQEYSALGSVSDIQVSSDGSVVGVATEGKMVYLLDRFGSLLWEKSTPSKAEKIRLSTNGESIGTSCMRFVYLFDGSGEEIWSFEQSGRIIDMDMSADGSRISAGGNLFYYLDTISDAQGSVSDTESELLSESASVTPYVPSGSMSDETSSKPLSSAQTAETPLGTGIVFGALAVVLCLAGGLRKK